MGKIYGIAKVNSKGAIVIPAELRRIKNIQSGDELAVEENEDCIIIKRGKIKTDKL